MVGTKMKQYKQMQLKKKVLLIDKQGLMLLKVLSLSLGK